MLNRYYNKIPFTVNIIICNRFQELAAKRLKKKRKLPTSIALEEETIRELKELADWRGVPYQVLMRMFILDGLHKSQAAGIR